jgi:hypothetical protein
MFLDIIHRPVLYLKQRFEDWILSPSSGKNLFVWAQSIELVPISEMLCFNLERGR